MGVLAHEAKAPGTRQIRVEGHHRDALAVQRLQLFPDGRVIGGAQGDAVRPLLGKALQQGKAGPRVSLGILLHVHPQVVVPPLLPEAGRARGDLPSYIPIPPGLHHGKAAHRAAGGQSGGHVVGPVVQLLHDRQHPLAHLRLHIGPVVQHPVHGADGHTGPLRDHFDGCPHGDHPALC